MSQPFRVFYYEDDLLTALRIKTLLEQSPSKPSDPFLRVSHYLKARDAFRAIEQWTGNPPDVALLNVHEEDYTGAGIDICKRIKEDWPTVPVVMLSAFASIRDQIIGYEAGACGYLSKKLHGEPNGEELIMRTVILQLRKTTCPPPRPSRYSSGSLEVDLDIPRVRWRGEQVRLSPVGIDIVDELANDQNRGGLCTYARLAIAGALRAESKERLNISVKKHISNVRRAFREVDEEFGKADYGIILVPGRGYRWQADGSQSMLL